jgi:hypothetical protein
MIMEWVCVTPEYAAALLQRNANNRNLRSTVVDHYAEQMKRNEWKATHQAIAVGADGNVIDGQHRLSAIVKSGLSHWFWLCTYDYANTAMGLPIDLQARRNAADILQQDRRVTEVASIICRLMLIGVYRSVAVDKVRDVLEAFGSTIKLVNNAAPQKCMRRNASPVRAAVVLRLHHADSEEIREAILRQYTAFVGLNFDQCWPSTQSLIKQFDHGVTHLQGQGAETWKLIRAWKTFDWSTLSARIIRVTADDRSVHEMRTVALRFLPESWKKQTPTHHTQDSA